MDRQARPQAQSFSDRRSLVVLTFLLIELTLLLGGGILVLLVFRDKVIHVRFSLRELHLIHPLTSVPVKESFTAEHRSEVFCHTLEHFLNRCGVSRESNSHLQPLWRNIANGNLNIVWDPFHEIRRVFVLNI